MEKFNLECPYKCFGTKKDIIFVKAIKFKNGVVLGKFNCEFCNLDFYVKLVKKKENKIAI